MSDSKQKQKTQNPNLIELNGDSSIDHRIDYVKTLFSKADSTISHLDGIRQRNLVIALGIFGGCFGFMISSPTWHQAVAYPIVNGFFMLIFYIRDHNLHKYSEGWQKTRWKLSIDLANIINNPAETTYILRYDKSGEERVNKKVGWTKRIYILLVVGGFASLAVYFLKTLGESQ